MNGVAPDGPPRACIGNKGESERSEHNAKKHKVPRENEGSKEEDEVNDERIDRRWR